MDTRQCEQVKQIHLLEEVMRTAELARSLKGRMWDVFVKEKVDTITEEEAPPSNPIDLAIAISGDSQRIIRRCLELLETEIINKLVG